MTALIVKNINYKHNEEMPAIKTNTIFVKKIFHRGA